MTNAMRDTGLPEHFHAVSAAELSAAVALVRECRTGEHARVFGVEIVCVRRGWFQIVGGVKHELRSAGIVRLVAGMPSIRQEALIRAAREISAEMFGD